MEELDERQAWLAAADDRRGKIVDIVGGEKGAGAGGQRGLPVAAVSDERNVLRTGCLQRRDAGHYPRRLAVHRALQYRRELAEREPGTAHCRYFLPFVTAASWS